MEANLDRNVEFRVQRNYSNGMNLLASYIYERQQYTAWPDADQMWQGALWTDGAILLQPEAVVDRRTHIHVTG